LEFKLVIREQVIRQVKAVLGLLLIIAILGRQTITLVYTEPPQLW